MEVKKNEGLDRISLWDHFNHKSPRHSNISNKIQLHCITRGCIVYAFFFPLFFPITNVPATFLLPWLNIRTKRDLWKEFILNYSSREIRVHLMGRRGRSRPSDSLQQSWTFYLLKECHYLGGKCVHAWACGGHFSFKLLLIWSSCDQFELSLT